MVSNLTDIFQPLIDSGYEIEIRTEGGHWRFIMWHKSQVTDNLYASTPPCLVLEGKTFFELLDKLEKRVHAI